MAAPDKFFEQIFNEHLNNLHTIMPCRVVTYYPNELKADLQPLFKRKKGNKTTVYPIINKAPVLKNIVMCADPKGKCECGHYMELEEGQTVLVAFAERALDMVGNRRHDLTDAIVIGVM